MTPRKLLEFVSNGRTYRIVRVYGGFTALERQDGTDWLGVTRWRCVRSMDTDGWQTNTSGEEWVRGGYVRQLLHDLGDALNRLKLTPKRKRKTRRGAK